MHHFNILAGLNWIQVAGKKRWKVEKEVYVYRWTRYAKEEGEKDEEDEKGTMYYIHVFRTLGLNWAKLSIKKIHTFFTISVKMLISILFLFN